MEVSEESQIRLALARRLADECPAELASEIAVTGSAARGTADSTSDVEINLWAAEMPSLDKRISWLRSAGGESVWVMSEEPDSGGFRWLVSRIDGTWVETGWCQIQSFHRFVSELAAGAYLDHERLQFGWTVGQALPLRTSGELARWKERLSAYPDGLAERVVANQTSVWADPHVPGIRWSLAQRRERMGLALRFVWDMQNLLRVLFAVNQSWDQDLKWTDARSLDFPICPEHLPERINDAFTFSDLLQAVRIEQELIVETLELALEAGFDVKDALDSMRTGLRLGMAQSQ